MSLNASVMFPLIYCIVLLFVTIHGQSTNNLSSFYSDWIDDVSRSNDGNECQDCFQGMAGSLAEQLMSIKENLTSKNVVVFARLQGYQTVINNLRSVVNSGISTVNDMANYNTSAPTNILVGATGATGPRGATGSPGPIGPTGYAGQPGMPGAPGSRGQPGPSGYTGAAGDTGATGFSGPQGYTGATGAPGAYGYPGTPGAQGMTGPTGQTGSSGPIGAPGASG